jgi:DeoR/GlpR family transcriptional regulator of sugar metabolism
MADLLKEERLQQILDAVHENGRVTVAELGLRFEVSEITIRRDLRELAEQGLLRRAHGGALSTAPTSPDPPVIRRMSERNAYKERIGQAAAKLVADGESVFIGSGSTTAYTIRHLAQHKDLTVVTNALNVATELASAEHITVVVLGGMLRASELSLIGHITEQALKEVRVDKAIIGIPAISLEAGLTNDYLPEVMTDRAIIDAAAKLILVADHTKFDKVSSAYLAPFERVDTLVTDDQVETDVIHDIRALGVSVVVV